MSAIKWTSCGNADNYGVQHRVRTSKKAGRGNKGEQVFTYYKEKTQYPVAMVKEPGPIKENYTQSS